MIWLQTILAGIRALPEVLKLLKSLGEWAKQQDLDKDMGKLEDAINAINKIKTLDDAKRGAELLRAALKRL